MSADFFWALSEAVKCISRGAQLRRVTCNYVEASMQPAQWGASLVEQYGRLGGQLSCLRELEVWGGTERLLSALGAVISSAPHLTCVKITITKWLPRMELPPICSASLESITVTVDEEREEDEALPQHVAPLVLTFLSGCTRLQQVLVRLLSEDITDGTTAKVRCQICCHSDSPAAIVPMDVHARAAEYKHVHGYANCFSEVGVQLLPGPPPSQGVKYTVLYISNPATPQQPFEWSHAVVPGSCDEFLAEFLASIHVTYDVHT